MCLLCCCRLVWKPFLYLDESDVAGSLAKAGAAVACARGKYAFLGLVA